MYVCIHLYCGDEFGLFVVIQKERALNELKKKLLECAWVQVVVVCLCVGGVC